METNKVIDHIVNWLKDYAVNAKMDGFVVGISGGIDSAVTATLCAKTGLPTLCVELPIHQAESQINRAKEHIESLKIKYPNVKQEEVNLTSVFEELKIQSTIPTKNPLLGLSLANTRARLRMTSLYYFSGLYRFLVAGTGNKVEDFGVGFFTKYGDGGVDISPIADLLKSEVYMLAKQLDIIPSIVNAAPTDGLFGDDRTDEDQIGANYDELEWAMKMKNQGFTSHDFKNREKTVFDLYTKLHKINQHKMIPIPVCNIPQNFMK